MTCKGPDVANGSNAYFPSASLINGGHLLSCYTSVLPLLYFLRVMYVYHCVPARLCFIEHHITEHSAKMLKAFFIAYKQGAPTHDLDVSLFATFDQLAENPAKVFPFADTKGSCFRGTTEQTDAGSRQYCSWSTTRTRCSLRSKRCKKPKARSKCVQLAMSLSASRQVHVHCPSSATGTKSTRMSSGTTLDSSLDMVP